MHNMLGYRLPEIDANIVTTSHDHSCRRLNWMAVHGSIN